MSAIRYYEEAGLLGAPICISGRRLYEANILRSSRSSASPRHYDAGSHYELTNIIRLICGECNAYMLRIRKAKPLVHFGICRSVCTGLCVRVSTGSLAVRTCGSGLGPGRSAALADRSETEKCLTRFWSACRTGEKSLRDNICSWNTFDWLTRRTGNNRTRM